jgi:hypothetical protein
MTDMAGSQGMATGYASRARKKPSAWWYLAAALLAVFGIVGAVVWGVTGVLSIHHAIGDFPRIALPGDLTVPITGPGTKIIYYEGAHRPAPGDLDISVTGPSGETVKVEGYDLNLQYDANDRAAHPIGKFVAGESGQYVLSAVGPGGSARISVGDNIGHSALSTILGALILAVLAECAAVTTAVVTFARRYAWERSARS